MMFTLTQTDKQKDFRLTDLICMNHRVRTRADMKIHKKKLIF